MNPKSAEELPPIGEADQEELIKLVNAVALSDRTLTLFAISPESAPDHPVVKHLQRQLDELAEPLQFLTFFYSDNSLFNFLADLDSQSPPGEGRRVILAFGLEQLPTPRLKNAMEQLNLAREAIFERNLVLIFWLNRESFLDEFRSRAPDFWDWRGKVASFVTHHPLLYPYLEWLIAENSYLKMSGVMQVNRQVDIFLDQIYVSLQAERRLHIDSTSTKHQQEFMGWTLSPLKSASSSSGLGDLEAEEGCLPFDMSLEMGQEFEALESATSSSKTVTETVDLADVVRGQNSCSVILGAPGAGKTTLLRYLALHFAKAKRDDAAAVQGEATEEELGSTRLPIFFRIADYAEQLEAYPDLSLLDYLVQFYRRWEDYFDDPSLVPLASEESEESFPELPGLLLTEMGMGDCLILLDGLDEVFDQESRRRIVGRINDFAEQYSNNKIIVTSRIAGYQEVKLSSRFLEFTITDMGDEQVSQFLHRWCLAVEQAQKTEALADQQERDGDRQAELILQDIRKNAGVKRLTANPLLLTILALIHRNGERLPERRVKLYELAVQTLTADWQLSKKLPNVQKVLLPEGEVVALLAPLAYWMHEEKPSGLVTHAEVQQQLAPKLAELRGEAVDALVVQQAVEEFLRRVRETTGLFVERAPDVYGFMHLTFEEYFAARYIADNDRPDVLELIQKHWHEPRWEEPILLALAYYGSYSPAQLNKLVEQLFADLEQYQPVVSQGDIRIKHRSAQNNILVFPVWNRDSEIRQKESETILQPLLLAGKVLSQVELNSKIQSKLVEKLVLTYIGLPELCFNDSEHKIENQLLTFLRQIESFRQTEEVKYCLARISKYPLLPVWKRMKIQLCQLNLACDMRGSELVDYLTELISQLDPFCFGFFMRVCEDGSWGSEISHALELVQPEDIDRSNPLNLGLITALSYLRENHVDKAITLLEELCKQEHPLIPLIRWAQAVCYKKKKDNATAIKYYQNASEQLKLYPDQNALCCFWQWWATSYSSIGNYEKTIECMQHGLSHAQNMGWKNGCLFLKEEIAETYQRWNKYEPAIENFQTVLNLYSEIGCDLLIAKSENNLGEVLQANGKYEKAISYYEQSRDLYELLKQPNNVATQWCKLAGCYREWGKYEKAISHQQRAWDLRQTLDDAALIAISHFQFGYIYEAWGKYEKAIEHYQQSRDLYQQLGQEKDVANQWKNLAGCYREWGKYEKAIEHYEQSRDLYQQLERPKDVATQIWCLALCYMECSKHEQAIKYHQQSLSIHQSSDDKFWMALDFLQLGRINQSLGKYGEAIESYQQSRDLYQQLGQEKDVASQWSNLADCYRKWCKYEKAISHQQRAWDLRQTLDDAALIAISHSQFGYIYEAWGKYEKAIEHYQQSRDLYQQLGQEKDVASQWKNLADCYRELKQYTVAFEYYQKSCDLAEAADLADSVARRLSQMSFVQVLLVKDTLTGAAALEVLTQAEQTLQRAMQLNRTNDYREKLAYDHTVLALLYAERLRQIPAHDAAIPDLIAQFEEAYQTGLATLAELGQHIGRAEEALDIARAYLEVETLKNCDRAEDLASESLKMFQTFNRRHLEASARKLLGEIYLSRSQQNHVRETGIARQFLLESQRIYQELDLTDKATEVETLLQTTLL